MVVSLQWRSSPSTLALRNAVRTRLCFQFFGTHATGRPDRTATSMGNGWIGYFYGNFLFHRSKVLGVSPTSCYRVERLNLSKPTLPAGSSMRLALLLFGAYSFVENLLRILLELLPHPLRYWIFKALLARLGTGSMIDYQTYFRYPWKISIGNGVSINRGCEFYGSMLAGNARITIGDHCALGPRVRVLSATHDYRRLDLPDQAESVTIGRYAWIGAGATILPGVNIGEGAVVAAASVVTRDVAPYSIVAGNPARFIKSRELDDECPI